jgi:surfactin family lipopeptide synthetase A
MLPAGEMEYHGRIDHQVKVRGFRIEPGEIEDRLLRHEAVKEAVVLAGEDEDGHRSLRAYVVFNAEMEPDPGELRTFLAVRLPEYMVPAYFITLDRIPLTANGKVDGKSLLTLKPGEQGTLTASKSAAAPSNETERRLVQLWQHVLGIESTGVTDNFFNVGGDSIKAIKLVHQVNDRLGVELKVPDLYMNETIQKLALKLEEIGTIPVPVQVNVNRNRVLERFAEIKQQVLADPRTGGDIEDAYPMSDIEKGMIFHSLKDDGAVYHDQFPYRLRYPSFDLERFQQALALMAEKHESLRAAYNVNDYEEPLRLVYREVVADIEYRDISLMDKAAQEKKITAYMETDRQHPFDTGRAPLWRMRVFDLGRDTICALWIIHHAIIDGWSNASLMTELNNTYLRLGKDPHYKPAKLKSSYRDFIVEQCVEKQDPEIVAYWKEEMADYKRLRFPAHLQPQENGQAGMNRITLTPGNSLLEQVQVGAAKHNTAVKHLFFAAYLYMLAMLSYENDIVTGLVTHNRPVCEDGDRIVGCFLNTVPVRVKIPCGNGTSWADFLRLVDEKLVTLTRYHRLSLYEIVRISGETTGRENPFFDTLFNFTDFHIYNQALGEGSSSEAPAGPDLEEYENTNTLFDFGVHLGGGSLRVILSHSEALLAPSQVETLCRYFLRILEAFIETPAASMHKETVMSTEERQQLVGFCNGVTLSLAVDKTIVQLFEEQVERTSDHIAAVGAIHESPLHSHPNASPVSLTYRELNEQSTRLAHILKEKGAGAGTVVALVADRTVETLIGVLGILKTGGAYLPIDPSYPQERIDYILKDSGAKLAVGANSKFALNWETENCQLSIVNCELPMETPGHLHLSPAPEPSPAYVIYTSGSTGNPKGVMVTQRNLCNLVAGLDEVIYSRYADMGGLRVGLLAAFVFDASVQQVFAALLLGHTLCIVPEENKTDGAGLASFYRKYCIDISDGTPTHIRLLLEAMQSDTGESGVSALPVRHYLIGGEALPLKAVQDFLSRTAEIEGIVPTVTNVYGPSECCVDSSYFHIPPQFECPGETIPIGRPMPNVSIFVLDKTLRLQPVGVAGELCITGEGIGLGYLNNPELTAKRFVISHLSLVNGKKPPYLSSTNDQCPLTNDRFYRTGDLVRWLPDGNLEFLGRLDFQVKIRGFRIELGEIENRLRRCPGIDEAVVIAGQGESPYLCAYLVSAQEPDVTALREFLSRSLPDYMIPAYFVRMEQLPLTTSGKLDRKALPEPRASAAEEYIAPAGAKEERLAAVIEDVLEVDRAGLADNFFEMGGDSIKAIQVAARLQGFGYKLEIRDLLSNPTLKAMAAFVKPLQYKVPQEAVTGQVPLTPIQIAFFREWQANGFRLNQAVMLYRKNGFDELDVKAVFKRLTAHHDALRMAFLKEEETGTVSQQNLEPDTVAFSLETVELKDVEDSELELTITAHAQRIQSTVFPFDGPLVRLGLFRTRSGDHLMVAVHHLVMDGVSWRILLEDMGTAFAQTAAGQTLTLPDKTHSFKYWAEKLADFSSSEELSGQLEYWKGMENMETDLLNTDFQAAPAELRNESAASVVMELETKETTQLLTGVHRAYNTGINDILLTALACAFFQWQGLERLAVDLEGHGREPVHEELDVSRTVGWFTARYPVVLELARKDASNPDPDPGESVKQVKEILRRVPLRGVGYEVLKYLTPLQKRLGLNFRLEPEIGFNYLGQFVAETGGGDAGFRVSPYSAGNTAAPGALMHYTIDINGMVANGRFSLVFVYNTHQFRQDSIGQLADMYKSQLQSIIRHCLGKEESEMTLSDYSVEDMEQEEMDTLFEVLEDTFAE